MADQNLKGLVRLIDLRKRGDKASAESMIELGEATNPSGDAGAVPTCTVDGDDEADVFEPYGLAGQPASGDALLFASEGDSDNLTAIVSSVAGRPATEPGDKVLWTAAGHQIFLADAGGITITSKDGATITLDENASITLDVAAGKSVNVGDALAEALVKSGPFKAAMSAALAAGASVAPTPMAGNNGSLAFQAAQLAWDTSLASDPIDTTKAKGT